jgi:hypothetical protein
MMAAGVDVDVSAFMYGNVYNASMSISDAVQFDPKDYYEDYGDVDVNVYTNESTNDSYLWSLQTISQSVRRLYVFNASFDIFVHLLEAHAITTIACPVAYLVRLDHSQVPQTITCIYLDVGDTLSPSALRWFQETTRQFRITGGRSRTVQQLVPKHQICTDLSHLELEGDPDVFSCMYCV